MTEIKISKELYPKIVVLKTAYQFTDSAYIFVNIEDDNYIVEIEEKEQPVNIEKAFKEELLAQALRYEIFLKTKNIRELLVARAVASSSYGNITDERDVIEKDFDIESIVTDWFDNEEDI